MPGASIDRLVDLLTTYRPVGAFNQYRDVHPGLDRCDAASIRVRNLCLYLERFSGARFILVGEAAGYAGCRFTGIPFTSEAQITGPEALPWTRGMGLIASSLRDQPWREASAQAVWRALGDRADCLLWNAYPWHPYRPARPLSNRAPGREARAGSEALCWLLAELPRARPVAVVRTAQGVLSRLGICAHYLRHPSHGGARAFEAGLAAL